MTFYFEIPDGQRAGQERGNPARGYLMAKGLARKEVRMRKSLGELLKEKIIILDGATGTNLQKRGMPGGVCPEQWIIEHPQVLMGLQREYADAGCDIVYAPTFSGNAIKLKEYGLEDKVDEINRRLVEISREAVGGDILVAGDMTMTGQQLAPMGALTFEELLGCYEQQARALAAAGVDVFIVETMMSLQETRAAVMAIRRVCDIPVMVTMTFNADGHTLYGTDGVTALIVLQSLGVAAFGMNCSCGPEHMGPMLEAMKPYAKVPLIVKANAGLPEYVDGKTVFSMEPEAFASENVKLVEKGAALVGGCCGTTPEHIQALSQAVGRLAPIGAAQKEAVQEMPGKKCLAVLDGMPLILTSERRTWFLDGDFKELKICPVNVKNDEELFQDLADGCFDVLYDRMEDIADEAPDLIVVCVDGEGIDGKRAMAGIFQEMDLSIAPMAIASENMETLEWGLRHYPGRALVGVPLSGGGKENARELAKWYGAAAAPMDELL